MSTDGTVGSAVTNTNSPPTSDPPIQWDGDRMFNIYIYDYCLKRGFHKTAHELMVEAQIPPQSQPPINAKQGLLFEWWSVFWVLFTAKSSGHGPDEALLYTQHQTQMQNAAQKQRVVVQQGQPQPARYANGVRPPNQPGSQINGVGAPPPQPGSLPNGAPSSIPFPGNAPQPNGVPGSSAGPPGASTLPPGSTMPPGPPNQRAVPPQQRGPNGAPFQSPTMAHSPPNPPNAPQPPLGTMGPVGANQPLTQISRSGMPPPNAPQGPLGPQQTPQPGFPSSLGRSPSNPGSPAQNSLMHPSPSMQHRQINPDMEINRIPPQVLQKLKQDLSMGDKEVAAMTLEEKQQLVAHFRRAQMKPPNMPGPSTMPGGQQAPMQPPSGLRNAQLPPNAQQPGHPPLPQQTQNQQQRGAKRNSTSPGQEPEQLPRNESSPPDRKRMRTSPGGGDHSQPPMTPMYPPPQQQPVPGGPPMQHPSMRGGPMQMQAFPGQPMSAMGNQMLGHGIGTPQMGPMNPQMNQGMMGAPAPAAMHQYRQAMQNIHKPPHLQPQMMPGGVPSPSAADAQGGMPGGPPANRMGQTKPMGMMPPPSPAMAAKTAGGPPKVDEGGAPNASPQNMAAGIGGQAPGQNPPPGAPSGPAHSSTPAPPTPNASTMTAPSPSAILNASTPTMSNHPPPPPPPPSADLDPNAFGIDFGAGLADFDPNFLNGESSLNFERDFAAWFDPENA